MRIKNMLKLTSLIALVFAVAVGCTTTEDTGGATEQAAKDAIAAAKQANKDAKAVGYEWRDTAKMIKKAEEALAAGDYDKAIKLANQAKRQADSAIAQEQAERARIAGMFGDTAPPPVAGSGQYAVVSGDNLWNISAKADVYNNPYQWPLIYKANSGKIKDADLIYPGQVFDINTNPSAAEASAAVTHAKTRGAWSLGVVEDSDKAYLAQ
jgi:nucleoid-associated protein YgaU